MKLRCKTYLFFGLAVLFSLACHGQGRKFPKFSIVDSAGKEWNEECFREHFSVVVLFHLGCPPAMTLIKDLNEVEKPSNAIRILAISENTNRQIADFFESEESPWPQLRTYYSMPKKLTFPVIGECRDEAKKGDDLVLAPQCRKITKRFWSRSSPLILLVDQSGRICEKHIGYVSRLPEDERKTWILANLFAFSKSSE